VSEREILDAAEQLLRELPFREVTVERIMARTGLKRPAFYVHFRDRHDLVLRLVQEIGGEVLASADSWLGGGDEPDRDILVALRGSVHVYASHGPMLRALADAAASDARVEDAYRGLVRSIVDAVASRIRAEQDEGRIAAVLDAEETARALVWLNERYLYETLGRPPGEEEATIVGVLHRIWLSTLYGGPSAAARA
jgi:AcrR family transcriptional regulator